MFEEQNETEIDEAEAVEPELEEVEEAAEDEAETEEAEGDEQPELVISIDGEEDEPEESEPLKALREKHREQRRRIRELEEQVAAGKPPEPELGERPKLSDFDFDDAAFEAALLEWSDRKRAVEQKQAEAQQAQEKRKQAYAEKMSRYREAKSQLPSDMDDAEATVIEDMSVDQQSLIVEHAEKPELLVYALGKNPSLRKRLAGMSDLLSFAVEIGRLEKSMKVTGKTKPQPEKRVVGGTGVPKNTSKQLQALKAKADQTGDYTEYFAAKRAASK